MATTVLEGTWEEIQQHADKFNGHRLRVTILEDEENKPEPNWKMKEIMKQVRERQKGRPFTDGSKTQEILRRGRAGEMFGYPVEQIDE